MNIFNCPSVRSDFVGLMMLIGILLLPVPATAQDFPTDSDRIPDVIEFNRDIRPVLSNNCFFCHGPDANKREADLRLDSESGLLGAEDRPGAIVPGDPEQSPLFQRITSSDPDQLMPPAHSGKELTPHDVAIVKAWIQQGGHFEGHWAFQPIRTGSSDSEAGLPGALSDRIDILVASSLAKHNLTLSPEADRITLIRRLSMDLIGLPPDEQDVAEFLADTSAEAIPKLVDRLLHSPHYGERLAMWWLDLVRYADTVGYHGDQQMSVSPFRQYVIDSFNANKPFDQFTVEQLAGDLLPDRTREHLIASGYNRLGMMSAEGGVQDREYLAKYIAERVRNASGTWLGLTLGCAECHDHKFDPLTTRDFYRFQAFFADIRERGLYAGASQDGNWGPYIKVPNSRQEAELTVLDQQLAATRMILDTSTAELEAAQAEWEQQQVRWTVLNPHEYSAAEGTTLTLQPDGSVLASGMHPDNDTYELTFLQIPSGITAFRLEVLPDDSLPKKGPGRAGNGNFVLSEFIVRQQAGESADPLPVPLQNATASYEQTGAADGNPYGRWAAAAAIDGDEKGAKWGWAVMEKVGEPHLAVFETAADLTLPEGQSLTILLQQNPDNPKHTIGRFRLSVTTAARPVKAADALPTTVAEVLAVAAMDRSIEQQQVLASHYRTLAPLLDPARTELARLQKERDRLDAEIPSTLITETVPPRTIRILPRGNWMDESGEIVTPALPEFLTTSFTAPPSAASEGSDGERQTRLDLAKWIVHPENPLTARVVVNRLWKIYFGNGLSRKLDDLGAQGEWPGHPELLDELAAALISSDWNLRELIRSIVLSKTYRQSSLADPELLMIDPDNRLLARQARFRLDAELVRDNALAISGLLVTKIGGRSVHPYQPPGYWAYLNFPTREWKNGSGDELYRRGLYTHWQRQYLHPSLLAFDAPSREECTADRPRSNTPLQSLVLLNDPSYVEAARVFAELILRHGGTNDESRLHYAMRRALSRSARAEEVDVLKQLLETHLAEYQSDPNAAAGLLSVGDYPAASDLDPIQLAAWTSVARAVLNLHETITRN